MKMSCFTVDYVFNVRIALQYIYGFTSNLTQESYHYLLLTSTKYALTKAKLIQRCIK